MGCLSYNYTVLIFTRLLPVTGIRLLTTTLRASVFEIAGRAPRVYRVHHRLIHHLAKAVERGGLAKGRGGSAFIAFLFAPRPIFMAPPDDAAASPKDAVKVDLSEVASTRPKPPNKPPPPKPSKPAPQPPVRTSAAEPPHVPKPPLPEGWKVLKTPEGKTYYYNKGVRNVPPLSCLMMTTPISFQTFNVDKIHACRY